MIDNINKLEKILQRFKFKQPVPPDIQKRMLNFKRRTVADTLKHFGEYNIFYGSVLRFHFFTKRIGINLSALQSEIIFVIVSITAAVLALAGVLVMTGIINYKTENISAVDRNQIFYDRSVIEMHLNENLNDVKEKKIFTEEPVQEMPEEKKNGKFKVKTRLGIQGIISEGHEDLASGITDILYSRLKDFKGPGRIVYRKVDGIDKSVNRLLTGRLNRIGSTYILSLSIANAETGKLLYDMNYSFKEADEIDEILNQVAENISDKKELW